MADPAKLSRRERQIMEIVYANSQEGRGVSANDVLARMADPPTRTSIRTFLRILEQKGHLTHGLEGREFVYRPVVPREKVGPRALRSVLHAFFGNSLPQALAAYFADPESELSAEELKELRTLVREAKERGR